MMVGQSAVVGLALRRDGSSTLGEQLKGQLRFQILVGELSRGARVPTVRALAGFLRVNRNTVAAVYRDLEREGFLEGTPGRGTFVRGPEMPPLAGALGGRLDDLIETAAQMRLTMDQLRDALMLRASRRPLPGRDHPRLAFVECNPSDLAYFTRILRDAVDVPVVPMLLSDLAPDAADLFSTTFFHAHELRRRLPGLGVAALLAVPDFATMETIARLPAGAEITLICATEEGVRSKARSIRAAGLRSRITTAHLGDERRLGRMLAASRVVVAAPKVLERLSDRIPPGARRIPFASVLGEGALAHLRDRIAEWQSTYPAGSIG